VSSPLLRDISKPRANARNEESRLADLAVAETRVVERIHEAGARVAVIVRDACRDTPLRACLKGQRVVKGRMIRRIIFILVDDSAFGR
jgi:hypothetical protein